METHCEGNGATKTKTSLKLCYTHYTKSLLIIRRNLNGNLILTPKRHEDSKEHGGRIIKEVGYLCEETRVRQQLVLASLIAEWTQGSIAWAVSVADFFTGMNFNEFEMLEGFKSIYSQEMEFSLED